MQGARARKSEKIWCETHMSSIAIPEPIKRLVRQEAGFGCCKCGFPIYDYHHIVTDSTDAEDIMILCPNHHREATEGAMDHDEQLLLKQNPHNILNNWLKGYLKINRTVPVIAIGLSLIIGEGDIIQIDSESLLSLFINEGRLEISLKLYDKSDRLVFHVERNEWMSGDPFPWDMEAK